MKLSLKLKESSESADVLVVGENSVDLLLTVNEFPQLDAKLELVGFAELPGGEGATAAVGLARLGWRAKYLGRFADDAWGRTARRALSAEGVDVSVALLVPDVTNRFAVVVIEQRSGRRTVLWQRAPQLALQPADIRDDALATSRVLLVGSDDVDAMTSAAKRARRFGLRTVGDIERIHSRTDRLLRELDIVVMAASFPQAFTGTSHLGMALREVAELSGAALTCVTLGEEGCLASVAGEEIFVPAIPTTVVDTTGAGDLFRAGLIARWLMTPAEPDVESLLRYATVVAALGCRAAGAWTAAPTAAEVDALLNS